jgi:hypothetical protein
MLITWPSCTRSGPTRPPRPANSTTVIYSRPAYRPGTGASPGHQARWLWRTLRAAELAGLDPGDVLAAAISERDLVGARDLAVIDARIRYRTGALVPAPTGPWSFQVPAIADATRHAYLTEITALMDACQDRIGEHAARHALPRAVTALGPVPDDPQNRAEWQKRAASIGAWRELSGHRDPADPIRLPRPRRSCLLVVDTLVTQRRRGGFARRRSHTGTRPGSQRDRRQRMAAGPGPLEIGGTVLQTAPIPS